MNLNPKIITTFPILITIILAIYLFIQFQNNKDNHEIKIKINQQNFTLEIANNPISRSRGLSKRDSLCQNCSMIFIYNKEGTYPFWMKDTLIPLDIIWLDKDGIIVDLKTGQPQSLSILKNQKPAQYIIELNQNATSLKIGDTINLPDEITTN